MHHHPQNQERALNLSILIVSGIYYARPEPCPRCFGYSDLLSEAAVSRRISTYLKPLEAHRFARVAAVQRNLNSPQDRPRLREA